MAEMTLLDPANVRHPVPTGVGDARIRRRRRPRLGRDTIFDLLGAAAAGVSASFLLFGRLAAFSGSLGFFLVAYLVFLIVYALLVSLREDAVAIWDAVMTVVLTSAAIVAFGALAMVVSFTLWRGRTALLHSNFFTQDMSRAGPLAPLSVGGVAHALVGTIWTIGIAVVLTVPLGIVCAVYLDQTRGRAARFVRTIVLAMTALPSILAGLFIYASWILTFGFQQSGFAAALALSIMMLPYIIRTSDLVLRLVPGGLREASAALGAPRWRTVMHVVIPTARSGLATGVILGIARGIGEASPVLLTAGFTTYINADPFHGPMVSLPLEALKLVQSGVPTYVARGFAAATFLLLVIMGLFILARVIGGWGPGHLNRRQRRRAERASARDVVRISRLTGGGG
jgi:phosphate transport system permease protein